MNLTAAFWAVSPTEVRVTDRVTLEPTVAVGLTVTMAVMVS